MAVISENDPNGNEVWTRQLHVPIPATFSGDSQAVAADSTGIYVTGLAASYVYLSKYDSNGNEVCPAPSASAEISSTRLVLQWTPPVCTSSVTRTTPCPARRTQADTTHSSRNMISPELTCGRTNLAQPPTTWRTPSPQMLRVFTSSARHPGPRSDQRGTLGCGARSRGPVTAQGKERSSKNAVKHGLASATIVLTTEDWPNYLQCRETYIGVSSRPTMWNSIS